MMRGLQYMIVPLLLCLSLSALAVPPQVGRFINVPQQQQQLADIAQPRPQFDQANLDGVDTSALPAPSSSSSSPPPPPDHHTFLACPDGYQACLVDGEADSSDGLSHDIFECESP